MTVTIMAMEETFYAEILACRQIEPSDSPCSALVVIVPKKDFRTRFCMKYQQMNHISQLWPIMHIQYPRSTTRWIRWPVSSGSLPLKLASGYWQVLLFDDARRKTPSNDCWIELCRVCTGPGIPGRYNLKWW